MGRPLTWTLDDFAGGVVRQTIAPANTWWSLVNWRVNKNKKLVLKPPLRFGGAFGSATMGLWNLNGRLVSLRPKGSTWDSVSSLPAGVEAMPFDVRDGATAWDLESWCMLGDTLVVMLANRVGSTFIGLDLHVFDGKADAPTWVDGSGAPWRMATSNYHPRLIEAVGCVLCTGQDGQTWRSAIGQPRIWWEKTADDIALTGFEFTARFAAATASHMLVPVDHAKAIDKARYCAVVMERWYGGQWIQAGFVPTASAQANAFGSSQTFTNLLRFDFTPVAGALYRVRVVPPANTVDRQPVRILSGCVMEFGIGVTASRFRWTFEGDGKTTRFPIQDGAGPLSGSWVNNGASKLAVVVGGATKYYETDFTIGERSAVDGSFDIVFFTAPASAASIAVNPYLSGAGGGTGYLVGPGQVSFGEKTYKVPAGTGLANDNDIIGISISSDTAGVFKYADGTPTWWNYLYRDHAMVLGQMTSGTFAPLSRDSAWDEVQVQLATAQAGDHDAGTIPTGSHSAGQGVVKALASLRGRVLVVYRDACELWAIDAASQNDRFLDASDIGVGDHTIRELAVVDGSALVPTPVGISVVSLTGDLVETLDESNALADVVGDDAWSLPMPTCEAAANWSRGGATLVFGRVAGVGVAWVFQQNKGWKACQWSMSNADAGALILADRDGKLYGRSAPNGSVPAFLWWFDDTATDYRDDQIDKTGAPWATSRQAVTATAELNLNHLGRPRKDKRIMEVHACLVGDAQVDLRLANGTNHVGHLVSGNSYASPKRLPVRCVTQAVGFRVTSTDADGCMIESLGLVFQHQESP